MKKDAYYFSHFSNARHDRRIKRLRKELGIEGYGIYFMLLEVLREQIDFSYPISDIDLLAEEFGTSEAKMKTVLTSYDLFQINGSTFTSLKFIYYLTPYLEKSQRARDAAKTRWDKINANADAKALQMQCDSECKESKVNESKVNESKVEEESLPNLNLPTSPFISQSEILPLKKIIEVVSLDDIWLQAVKELSRCEDPKKRLVTFELFLVTENKTEKTITDFKSHFAKWLPFELKREKETLKNATNGRDFKNTAQQLREINKTNPNRHPSASGSEDGGYGER